MKKLTTFLLLAVCLIARAGWLDYPVANPSVLSDATYTVLIAHLGDTNVYQLNLTNLQENLGYVPQPASANGSNWAAIATSSKQDHSANLDLWNAVVPSSYQLVLGYSPQPASDNLTNWSALLTSAKQNHSTGLDYWDGVTVDGVTILKSGGVLSSAASGSGNVTGAASSTDSEIPLYSGTTGKSLKGSGHFLADYLLLSQLASGSQNGVLSSADWNTFNGKQAALGFVPMTGTQVTNAINGLTLPLDPLSFPAAITIYGIDSATNPVPIHIRNNVTLTADGIGGYNLDASGSGGGSVSGIVTSNYFVVNTNLFIWDLAKVQKLGLRFETNMTTLQLSNSYFLTNGEAQLSTWEDTNGVWKVSNVLTLNGITRTNGNGLWRGTNASQDDEAILRLDSTGTNIWFTWNTNLQPVISFTNSLASSGGGGGGGSGFTLINHTSKVGTSGNTVTTAIDTTGANLDVILLTYDGGTTPTVTSSLNASGWITDTNDTGHLMILHKISPSVGSDVVTVSGVSGVNVAFLAFSKAGGTPIFDGLSAGGSTANWQTSSLTAGSLTPSSANDLFVSLAWFDVANTGNDVVDSSFIAPDATIYNSASFKGLDFAYKAKSSSSTAENPGWTRGTANNSDAGNTQVDFQ